MEPDAPEGPGHNRLLILGGVVAVIFGYMIWRKKQLASSSSTSSGSSLNGTAYGAPSPGFGSVVPVIIQSPSGSSASVPDPTPTTNGASNANTGTISAPTSLQNTTPFFTQQAVNVPQWARIPNPTIGSALSSSGVPWQTIGNTQYYDPSVLEKIDHPDLGSQLINEGYNVFGIGGTEYYYPGQKVIPGTKGKFTNQ